MSRKKYLFFILFYIQPQDANENRKKGKAFGEDSANGKIKAIIDQPKGRADQRKQPHLSRLLHAEGDGSGDHTQGGQKLQDQIA